MSEENTDYKKEKPKAFWAKLSDALSARSAFFKNAMPFQDKKDPAGALSKAYISAFVIIAFVSIAVHLISSSVTSIQQTSIRNSNMLNQERILVEQIASGASKHYSMKSDLDLDLMKQTILRMENNHLQTSRAIKDSGFLQGRSKVLNKAYFEEPFLIDQNIKDYIEQAQIYTSYSADERSVERLEAYEYIQRQSRSALPSILNKALADYQDEIISKTSFYHGLQLSCLAIVLIVLIYEAAFIFHPLARKTRTYHTMLLKQALEDPLTGLSNRRAFMNRSEAAMKRAKRDNEQMIIALTDLDHFKSVNDTYGHDVGDDVLKHFSATLKKSLRGGDIIGRIGGEEFAVILPKTNYETGKEALERLCRDVETTPCRYTDNQGNEADLNYTVSMRRKTADETAPFMRWFRPTKIKITYPRSCGVCGCGLGVLVCAGLWLRFGGYARG